MNLELAGPGSEIGFTESLKKVVLERTIVLLGVWVGIRCQVADNVR